jgi:cell division protein ZapA
MGNESRQVTVHIMDRDYRVACTPEEEQALHDAARYLNEKMQEIRDRGRVVGVDRIAVMAALNLAHELLQSQNSNSQQLESVNDKIRHLRGKIDTALKQSKQMEL